MNVLFRKNESRDSRRRGRGRGGRQQLEQWRDLGLGRGHAGQLKMSEHKSFQKSNNKILLLSTVLRNNINLANNSIKFTNKNVVKVQTNYAFFTFESVNLKAKRFGLKS